MLERRGKIEIIVIIALMVIILTSAIFSYALDRSNNTSHTVNSDNKECQFVVVRDYDNFSVVYNSANLVMYIISEDGNATIMVDDDNKPMIWRGGY